MTFDFGLGKTLPGFIFSPAGFRLLLVSEQISVRVFSHRNLAFLSSRQGARSVAAGHRSLLTVSFFGLSYRAGHRCPSFVTGFCGRRSVLRCCRQVLFGLRFCLLAAVLPSGLCSSYQAEGDRRLMVLRLCLDLKDSVFSYFCVRKLFAGFRYCS
jgi:hypothetical protein